MVLVGHYHMGGVLGRGKFGWVSRATHQVVGYQVAVKHQPWAVGGMGCGGKSGEHADCQHVEETRWRAALENEAALLARVSHPSVVALLEVMRGPTGLYVCLEDLGDTTLAALVTQHFERNCIGLAEPIAAIIFSQVAAGLHHLHNQGILHRDVKPENIMVVPGKTLLAPIAKLIDLGLAAAWEPSSPLTTARTRAGTVCYMAPELTSSAHEYGPEVDVFSLGASLYFTLVGEVPFSEYVRNGCRGTTSLFGLQLHHEEALDALTPQAAVVLRAMLQTSPKCRWSLPRVAEHHWFCNQCSTSVALSQHRCSLIRGKGVIFELDSVSNVAESEKSVLNHCKFVKFGTNIERYGEVISGESCKCLPTSAKSYDIRNNVDDNGSSSNNIVNVDGDRKRCYLINMQCVGRVSSLLQKDSDDVLQHLGEEPWGPVGGMYNLLLHTTHTDDHTLVL